VIFSDRYGTPLTISMLDVDHFKQINDIYGHTVGDIVLPHSSLKAATEQAERLCKHIRSLRIKSGEQEITITVSIGVAHYQIHKENWQALLNRADVALYEAKNNGRDLWAVPEA